MRRSSLLRSIWLALLTEIVAAASPAHALEIVVDGPETILFDQAKDACDASDLPDAPARAFRNGNGDIVLFAPNFKNRAFVGPDFTHLTRDCAIRFAAGGSADPALLDDRSWLHAFHTDDGQTVFALASASFIPYRHELPCAAGRERTDCWLNGIAALRSDDGGATFRYLGVPPRQVPFPPPEPFDPTIADPPGFMTATNIVSWGGWLYTILGRRDGDGTKSHNCLARAPRENTLSWEVWSGSAFVPAARFDGEGWAVATTSCGATGPARQPNIRGLVLHARDETFIAVFQYRSTIGQGFFTSTSRDLIAWSEPKLLFAANLRADATAGETWVGYPSIIDPASQDRNFGSIGETANLVFVRFLPTGLRSVTRQLVSVPLRVED